MERKSVRHDGDVDAYIDSLTHAGRQADARVLLALMADETGERPAMWGPSMIGFGSYHYRYESGREGDLFLVGFAPRKANMVVYVMPGFGDYQALLGRLGKYRTGTSCLYLGRLGGIDLDVLRQLVRASVDHMRAKYADSASRGTG